MSLKRRQAFLLKLLTDEKLRKRFYAQPATRFPLSKQDAEMLRAIDRKGIESKALMLKYKSSGKRRRKTSKPKEGA